MIFPSSANPRIDLVPEREYSKDGLYEAPPRTAYAVYDAELGDGEIKPRPGLTLKWTPPGYDGTEEVLASCYAGYAANTLYRLRVADKTGVFRISDGASQTGDVSGSAKPSEVAQALAGLANVDTGDIAVYGRQLGSGDQHIEFVGRYAQDRRTPPTLSVAGSNTASATLTKLTSGGLQKVVLLLIAKSGSATLYAVTPGTWTHTVVKTGLPVEDYAMVQYGDSVYIASRTYGLLRYRIGGTLSDGEDPSDAPPNPPPGSLSVSDASPAALAIAPAFDSSTLPSHIVHGAPSWSGGVLDYYFDVSNFERLELTNVREIVLGWASADFSGHKLWEWELTTMSVPGRQVLIPVGLQLRSGAGYISPTNFVVKERPLNGGRYKDGRLLAWFGEDRDLSAVDGVKFLFQAYRIRGPQRVTLELKDRGAIVGRDVDNDLLKAILDGNTDAARGRAVVYGVAYENPSGVRGPIGAETVDAARYREPGWIKLVARAFRPNDLTGWKALLLRRHTNGEWRIVTDLDGDQAEAFDANLEAVRYDVYDDEDGAGLPGYKPTAVEANSPFLATVDGVLGVWKGCLAIGADRKVWVSAVGDASRYAPSPDDVEGLKALDPYDESQGVTFYASPNRAERVVAIVGQDNLYVCTETGVAVCAGDLPIDLTPPRRLIGSKPAIGRPCGFRNGIAVPAKDGLMHYVASRGFDGIDPMQQGSANLTEDVPAAWDWLVGAGAPKAYSDGSELFVLAGSRGLWADEKGRWTRCRFPEAQHSVLFHGSERYLVAATGRVALWDEQSRGTDYGQSARWTVTYHRVVGTRVTLKEAKLLTTSEASLNGFADGVPWSVRADPGVYDVDASACPPCVELGLELTGLGTARGGHALLQGAFGGKKD